MEPTTMTPTHAKTPNTPLVRSARASVRSYKRVLKANPNCPVVTYRLKQAESYLSCVIDDEANRLSR